MKKVIHILLFVFLFSLFIQFGFCDNSDLPGLIPYRKGDKWGFCDKNKKILIPVMYKWAFPFNEGLAKVNIMGKWSSNFRQDEGVYGGKWGFIDKSGKKTIQLNYDAVSDFSEGLAAVNIGAEYPDIRASNDFYDFGRAGGKWGFVNKTGKIIVPIKYDYVDSFKENLATVCLNHKWGFINKTGKVIIPITYDDIKSFNESLAAIGINAGTAEIDMPEEGKKTITLRKYGFIDKYGKIVIPIKYDYVHSFEGGLAAVAIKNKWGFVDKTGKIRVPIKYDDVHSFRENLAAVCLNNKWGFVNGAGKEVISLKYEAVSEDFSEGFSVVRFGNRGEISIINKTGKIIASIIYDFVWPFSEGLAGVSINGKSGFIDRNGKIVIPLKYNDVWLFKEGLASTNINDKWGFINKKGKIVIPPKYASVDYFSNGLARVDIFRSLFIAKSGYIDKNGTEYWED